MTRLLPEQQLLQQVRSIPALTGAPLVLLQALDEGTHEPSDLSDLLRAEPALAVCLLRMLGRNDEKRLALTASLQAGVISAGDETLRCVAQKIHPVGPSTSVSAERQSALHRMLWEHSIGVAVLTQALAKRSKVRGLSNEVAYCAGLLHNVGAIALQTLQPEKAVELPALIQGKSRAEVIDIERDLFGADRWSFGWMLAELWNLPASLQDALLFTTKLHESDAHCPADTEQLLGLIHGAEQLVSEHGCSSLAGAEPWPVDPAVLACMPVNDAREELRTAVRRFDRICSQTDIEPAARTHLLEDTGRALAASLQSTEDELYVAQSVAGVLRYGLRRLGDGDPVPGLLFRTMEFLGFRRMCHLTIDEASQQLTVRHCAVLGSAPRVAEERVIPVAADAFPQADVLTVDSKNPAGQELLRALDVHSCVVAPIHGGSAGCLGYLCADRGPDGPPVCPGEQDGLDFIAEQAGLLLDHERLTLELQQLATQDPLTGAATRRRLMDRLDFLIKQARRAQWPLALVIMDLDHFKRFNDTMGHQVGDELLKDMVRVLNANTRKGDLVARYGGEEFVVLLPGADREGALAAAEKLRSSVYEFGLANGKKYQNTPISISLGLAHLTSEDTSTSLIGRADEALYKAKENGRNRIELAA